MPKLPHWWEDAAVAQPAAQPAAAVAKLPAAPELPGRSLTGARELSASQCSIGIAEGGSSDDLPALRPRMQLARTMSAPPQASLELVIAMPEQQRAAQPVPRRGSFAAVKQRLQSLRGGSGPGSGRSPPPPPAPSTILTAPAKRAVPIKVEPKTFFANERTMLQWLNMSTLILFTSLALTSYNDPLTRNKTLADGSLDYSSQIAGAVLAPVAIVFIIYALYTYLWRAQRIARREPSARYDDRYGPAVLVLLLLAVTTTSIVLTITHADWHKQGAVPASPPSLAGGSGGVVGAQPSSLLVMPGLQLNLAAHAAAAFGMLDAVAAAGRACGQLPVAWPPFFRPRGAALASGGDALLLGGAYELLRVPLPSSNTSVTAQPRLLPAPGWDIASLARGADGVVTLLASSHSSGAAFASLDEASGAVVPASLGWPGSAGDVTAVGSGAGGALLVATAAGIEVLQRLNASAVTTGIAAWQAVRRLPADAVAAGLADGHVAALSYDVATDALLLLLDRAQPPTLRALRLRTGEVLADAPLPGGGHGGWSGLALAADGAAVYLTRASPPQLWRFARGADGALDCDAQA